MLQVALGGDLHVGISIYQELVSPPVGDHMCNVLLGGIFGCADKSFLEAAVSSVLMFFMAQIKEPAKRMRTLYSALPPYITGEKISEIEAVRHLENKLKIWQPPRMDFV